ncbi:hypothetical protein BU16DRAFT_587286 [Lophium mytilinum]|uniref:Uncharacterized protein n=1 Tax=Lophium mytilinum TaxID=390894 RepID=A0A6A6REM5_9PEZI|nr:hypothetical protein BU16DRAFT_587286 [Lophium mytilinum]
MEKSPPKKHNGSLTRPRMPNFRRLPHIPFIPIGGHRAIEECIRNREHLSWQVSTGQITALQAEYMDRMPGEPPKAWPKDVPQLLQSPVSMDFPKDPTTYEQGKEDEDEVADRGEDMEETGQTTPWWLGSEPADTPVEQGFCSQPTLANKEEAHEFPANRKPTWPAQQRMTATTALFAPPIVPSKRPPSSPLASQSSPKRPRLYPRPPPLRLQPAMPSAPRATATRSPYFVGPNGVYQTAPEQRYPVWTIPVGGNSTRQPVVHSGGDANVQLYTPRTMWEIRARENALSGAPERTPVDVTGFLIDSEGRRIRGFAGRQIRYVRENGWGMGLEAYGFAAKDRDEAKDEFKDQEMVDTSSDTTWDGE